MFVPVYPFKFCLIYHPGIYFKSSVLPQKHQKFKNNPFKLEFSKKMAICII